MDQSKKQKTTAEVSLKDSLNDWHSVVLKMHEDRAKRDYKFWEDSWNDEFED